MAREDQSAVIEFLARPETHGGESVSRNETHSAVVFLAGARAWKLKRAVRYDYLDFSTPERRRAACEAEVRLNRRTAPDVYLGVTAVVRRPDGSLALGGPGEPVDWLVEMNRFDEDELFDRLAATGALDIRLMRPLAAAIARFHATAQARPDHGGVAGMRWVVEGNAQGFREQGASVLDPEACERVSRASGQTVERQGALLEARRTGGWVRQCHGDLHLRNLVRLNGVPTLFDAVEFNDAIACTDVLYDVAFLLMDLWRRGLPGHANAVWNAYLAESGDDTGLALMPLFLACRAAVRAKTSATAARLQSAPAARRDLEAAARDYLAMAERCLTPVPPALVAIGGFSGTGKSTLSAALAAGVGAAPGAVVLRSDELRKRAAGVSPLERLDPSAYTAEASARVYAELFRQTEGILRAGFSVIADAVYARPADREAIAQVARRLGVPFVGLWLEAPEAVLAGRIGRRVDDASDADAAVLRKQSDRGAGPVAWARLDASVSADAVRDAAASTLSRSGIART